MTNREFDGREDNLGEGSVPEFGVVVIDIFHGVRKGIRHAGSEINQDPASFPKG